MLPEEFLQRSEEHASLCECATYHRMALPDIKDIPQINQHRKADGDDSQDTVDLGSPCEGHEGPTREDPDPPIEGEVATFRSDLDRVTMINERTGSEASSSECTNTQ